MVQVHRYPEGTRVVIRRGRLPMDPDTVGRAGIVLRHDDSVPDRYLVQLDGEPGARRFSEDELLLPGHELHATGSGS